MPIMDLLASGAMLLLHFDVLPGKPVFPFSMYLILKGVAFRDFASIMDMLVGIYILGILFFGLHTFFVYVFAAYLIQKAVFGFF